MEEQDFERLEKIVTKLTTDFSKRLDDQAKDFHTWIGVQGEDSQHKLDLVVEGFQMLSEKMDRSEERIDSSIGRLDSRLDRLEVKLDQVGMRLDEVKSKVDGVDAKIAAHPIDTEAHQGLYRVKER